MTKDLLPKHRQNTSNGIQITAVEPNCNEEDREVFKVRPTIRLVSSENPRHRRTKCGDLPTKST